MQSTMFWSKYDKFIVILLRIKFSERNGNVSKNIVFTPHTINESNFLKTFILILTFL